MGGTKIAGLYLPHASQEGCFVKLEPVLSGSPSASVQDIVEARRRAADGMWAFTSRSLVGHTEGAATAAGEGALLAETKGDSGLPSNSLQAGGQTYEITPVEESAVLSHVVQSLGSSRACACRLCSGGLQVGIKDSKGGGTGTRLEQQKIYEA